MGQVEVVAGDLLAQDDVDIIVNPANTHLFHGAGVAGLIRRGALGGNDGPVDDIGERWLREQSKKRPIPTGGACGTLAGHLPFKAIIHAVGPIWKDGSLEEEKLLWLAHDSAFKVATIYGDEWNAPVRLALPAISCGIFGFPVEKAAPIAVRVARQAAAHYRHIALVRFVLFDPPIFQAYLEALRERDA